MSRFVCWFSLFIFCFSSFCLRSVLGQGVAESLPANPNPIPIPNPIPTPVKHYLTGGPDSTSGLKIYPKQLISTVNFVVQAKPIPDPSCVVTAAFSLTGSLKHGFVNNFVNTLVVVPSVVTFTSNQPSANFTISTIPGQSYSGSATLLLQGQTIGCEAFGGYSYTTMTFPVTVVR